MAHQIYFYITSFKGYYVLPTLIYNYRLEDPPSISQLSSNPVRLSPQTIRFLSEHL